MRHHGTTLWGVYPSSILTALLLNEKSLISLSKKSEIVHSASDENKLGDVAHFVFDGTRVRLGSDTVGVAHTTTAIVVMKCRR
jgi:hypothetical protein